MSKVAPHGPMEAKIAAVPPQTKPANDTLPLIEKKEAEANCNIPIFNPTVIQYPTHEDLVSILLILGLRTDPVFGQDADGNLVNQKGNVVVPQNLRKFFKLMPARIVDGAGAAPAA